MKRILVGNNQSIWDIAVQEYGSVEGVKQLILDNPIKCDFEKSIAAGTELIITKEPIVKVITDYLSANRLMPATAVDVPFNISDWILATGIWNDNGFWRDNALWID